MDEKSMIIEQERQQKARRRKKYKKIKWIVGILVVVLVAGGVWYMLQGRYMLAEADSTAVEIVAGEGQELVYAQIVSIKGNEITYTVTDMPMMNMSQPQGNGQSTEQGTLRGNRTEGMEQSGQRGGRTEGTGFPEGMERPEGMELPDGMSSPKGMEMPEGMSIPEGMDFSDRGGDRMPDMSSGQMPDMGSGQRPGRGGEQTSKEQETITTYIPVGTEVTTKLGTVTTFSRLAAGDYVALITEQDGDEEIIMAVYIIG